MRTRTFVPGLTFVVAAAALLATVGAGPAASSESPRERAAQSGPQHVAGAAKHKKERVPEISRRWAAAWTTGNPGNVARLYTKDAVYSDLALGLVFQGREGVKEWETGSHQLVQNLKFEATGGFQGKDGAVVEGIFSGHITGAPRPFAVPAVSVLRLRGDLIRSSNDYYNRDDILKQSGLPADWTPYGN